MNIKKNLEDRTTTSAMYQLLMKIYENSESGKKMPYGLGLTAYLFETLRLLLLAAVFILPRRSNAWAYVLVIPVIIIIMALTLSSYDRLAAIKELLFAGLISSLSLVRDLLVSRPSVPPPNESAAQSSAAGS